MCVAAVFAGMLIYGFGCETTGLSPFDNELVTLQYADEAGEVTLYPAWEYDDEAALLAAFLADWSTIKRKRADGGALFVGYHTLSFDVPFVLQKALEHDAARDRLGWSRADCWNQLYRWPVYLDLAQLVGDDFLGFDALRQALLGSTGTYEGRRVPVYYSSGRYDVIEAYVRDQLAALREVHLALRDSDLYDALGRLRREAGAERPLE